jgi:hypothetical protein
VAYFKAELLQKYCWSTNHGSVANPYPGSDPVPFLGPWIRDRKFLKITTYCMLQKIHEYPYTICSQIFSQQQKVPGWLWVGGGGGGWEGCKDLACYILCQLRLHPLGHIWQRRMRWTHPPLPSNAHMWPFPQTFSVSDWLSVVSSLSRSQYSVQQQSLLWISADWVSAVESWKQCCGSGIRRLFDPWIRNRFFPDPGS